MFMGVKVVGGEANQDADNPLYTSKAKSTTTRQTGWLSEKVFERQSPAPLCEQRVPPQKKIEQKDLMG